MILLYFLHLSDGVSHIDENTIWLLTNCDWTAGNQSNVPGAEASSNQPAGVMTEQQLMQLSNTALKDM